MPRYIDADALYKETEKKIKANNERGMAVVDGEFLDLINDAFTEDCCPKSEYDAVVSAVDNSTKEFLKLHDEYQSANAEIERLKHILDCYALQYGTVKEQQDVIDKANQEFASEIFAEIEKWLVNEYVPYIRGYSNSLSRNLAELEKKYMENIPSPAPEEKCFTPEQVRNMDPREIHDNYTAIRKSMERW